MAGIELKYTSIYHFIHPYYIHSKSCRGVARDFAAPRIVFSLQLYVKESETNLEPDGFTAI